VFAGLISHVKSAAGQLVFKYVASVGHGAVRHRGQIRPCHHHRLVERFGHVMAYWSETRAIS